MKIILITIAKEDDKITNALFQLYAARLTHYNSFEHLNIKPVKAASTTEQKKKDAALLLKRTTASDIIILMDEKGKEYTSIQLAGFISQKMNTAIKCLIFVIGGAYGFDSSLYERSNGMISLSKLTLPHQLVKVVVAEQLYRAFTIIRNEKYHHGEY